MRVVKALVAFMGLLIVIGIGLVAYGLSLDKNAKDDGASQTNATPSVPVAGNAVEMTSAPKVVSAFGDIVIDIEPGEKLISYAIDGNQATVQIEGVDGAGARIVIISLTDKSVLGRILLQPTAQ